MSLGLVIGSAVGPEHLVASARSAEAAGFDEIWLAEDFFFTGGVAGANIALGATERIGVRLGVVSAVVRHPALLAMEVATTARAHPGRFLPGIGLGVPAWMRQMGLMPRSPLTAMRECVTGLRRLLRGEEVTENGEVFTFDGVRLVYPQTEPVPIHMGVLGPKMLQLSGEIADGSVLSVGAGVEYVTWARGQIDVGRERAGRTDPHHLTVFAISQYSGCDSSHMSLQHHCDQIWLRSRYQQCGNHHRYRYYENVLDVCQVRGYRYDISRIPVAYP